jgi:hypothetical protein
MVVKQRVKYVVDPFLLVQAETYSGSDIHNVRSVLAAYKWNVESANRGVQNAVNQIEVVERKL